ncbi:MAG: hypothetical protein SAJ12_18765 [Jaaginema sp. PMC 1079.18]|nr:hypothetical protein [Jaaginema sp. PMC 1080.18]MEC4853029.1 hypothetical protein [Jaaginema sp. PMC 1079.18]MEC4868576.1 hypothetical protein [Jaaginema sp. PMC 1078.18]
MKYSFWVYPGAMLWSLVASFAPYSVLAPTPVRLAPPATLAATPDPLNEKAIALTLADLPSGFTEIPPSISEQIIAQFAVLRQEFGQEDLPVQEVFAFFHPGALQAIGGFTGEFPTEADQAHFDRQLVQLQDPETQAQVLQKLQTRLQAIGDVEVQDYALLDNLNGFGDTATGFTLDLTIQGVAFQVDLISFRRDRLGVFTALLSRPSETRPSLVDLATTLDRRIIESLNTSP